MTSDGAEAGRVLLVLWVTTRCNLNCVYCYADAGGGGHDMTVETAVAAIHRWKDHPLTVQFAGGEPTLAWDLVERATREAEQECSEVSLRLQTNAVALEERQVRFLRQHRIGVGVSLDGLPGTNDLLRGRTAQAVDGIRLLGEYGVQVNLNAVVTKENVEELPGLMDLAWYLGNVEGIGLDLLRMAGRGSRSFAVRPAEEEQVRRILPAMKKRADEIYRLSGKRIRLREWEEARQRLALSRQIPYCYAVCGRAVAVLPEGDCYPCGSLAGEAAYYMGNVKDKEIRPVSLEPAMDFGCRECAWWQVCPGSCPSRRIRNGDTRLDCALRKSAFELAGKENVSAGIDPSK